MGQPRPPAPCLLVVAAFSRHAAALAWARERLEAAFGPPAAVGEPFEFNLTGYYEAEMGPGLRKQFVAFDRLVAADCLSVVKQQTNELEAELARSASFPEARPLNVDPGLLSLGKFVLATTKDQSHRVYLGDGIFGEVTLRYRDGAFEPWPWTYADYRLPGTLAFFQSARDHYRARLRSP